MDARGQPNMVMVERETEIDDAASLELLARLRSSGVLGDKAWDHILARVDEHLVNLAEQASRAAVCGGQRPAQTVETPGSDWQRVDGARRVTGHRRSGMAALWLWWLANAREDELFWPAVGRVAADMGFEPIKYS